MTIQCCKFGFGEGGWEVTWVTLSRPDVGANTENAIPPQAMHAFKPVQALGLRPSIHYQEIGNEADRG